MASGSIATGTESAGLKVDTDLTERVWRGQCAMAQVIMTRKQSAHRVSLHALLEKELLQLALE
jgi:hypothetical protein